MFKIGFGVAVAVLLLVFGAVWLYEMSLPKRDSWEVEGSGPVSRFAYSSVGGRPTELFVALKTGTTVADMFDMSLFGDLRPGSTPAAFKARHGRSQQETARAVLEAGEERDGDSLGVVTFRPLYAYPKPGTTDFQLAALLDGAIVDEIRRTGFEGLLMIADSTSGERLFCTVAGDRIVKIRWLSGVA